MSEGSYSKEFDPKTQEWIVRQIRTIPKQKPSEAFRRNFDDIDWRKKDEKAEGQDEHREEAEATRSTQT